MRDPVVGGSLSGELGTQGAWTLESHPNGQVRVTIVIPTWRRAAWLERCLVATLRQVRPVDEVIVVGRREDAPALEVVERIPARVREPVRWVEVDRAGHVAPVLAGLREAKGEIVAFLDDDTEPEDGWLSALLEPFASDDVACVGGRVVSPDFRGRVRTGAGTTTWYGKHLGNVGALETSTTIDVDGVMECNWAWRRSVLTALEFDARLDFDDASMYGLDLCLQAKARGLRVVYTAKARVLNTAGPRDPSLDRSDFTARTVAYSRNMTIIAMRRYTVPRRVAFLPWWFLVGERGSYGILSGIYDLLRRRPETWSRMRASFEGKVAGLRTLVG
jgi:GT2 family glycosyltransferase